METIRNHPLLPLIEQSLADYWQAEYDAYQRGEGQQEDLWADYEIDSKEGLPSAVSESFHFYLKGIEQEDRGSVWVYQLPLESPSGGDITAFVVVTETDGDDGWIEVFDATGTFVGAGRTYIEVISWGEPATIREMVLTSEMPEELFELMEATLWEEEE